MYSWMYINPIKILRYDTLWEQNRPMLCMHIATSLSTIVGCGPHECNYHNTIAGLPLKCIFKKHSLPFRKLF